MAPRWSPDKYFADSPEPALVARPPLLLPNSGRTAAPPCEAFPKLALILIRNGPKTGPEAAAAPLFPRRAARSAKPIGGNPQVKKQLTKRNKFV
jgi:hypothetical protein